MKTIYFFIILIILSFAFASCSNANNEKQQQLDAKEQELRLKEQALNLREIEMKKKKITLKEAVQLAKKQFQGHISAELKEKDAGIDLEDAYTGDFTGDDIEDIAIYYSLASRHGGNAIIGQGVYLFQNDGAEVSFIANYQPNFGFSFGKIKNGKVYVDELIFAEDDPRCCPSQSKEHAITIEGNKAF